MADFTMDVADDVAMIRFDAIERTMNTLTAVGWEQLAGLVSRVAADDAVRGAIIFSGKANGFCAGADLDEMIGYAGCPPASAAEAEARFDTIFRANRVARAIETCGKPFAVALGGLALGGGLELALACHYRVVANAPHIKLGLPEATIGLLPGGGGTQRLPRLIGVAKALPMLLDGKPVSPVAALALGLVDAVVPPGEEVAAARAWVKAGGNPVAPWDKADFVPLLGEAVLPDPDPNGNYPALTNIARAVDTGMRLPIDEAIVIETQLFLETLHSPQAKAMIRTLFGSPPSLRKGRAITTVPPVTKVAVLGAGMMGAGIAHVLAKAGITTVLVDTTRAAAENGKDYSVKLLERLVPKGLITRERADALLDHIVPTDDYADVAGSDMLIETVFEDIAVKAEATRKALAHLPADLLVASNTSTLPITRLAGAHTTPSEFVGLHFHSPVDRMDLVEVVRSRLTSEAALDRALALVRQIGKTAIVANDSPFFYTSRVFDTYIREGMEMLVDGIDSALIDAAGRASEMPRGPLELTDDVAVDLVGRIADQRRQLLGDIATRRRSDDVVDALLAAGRTGRKSGCGFYDYPSDGPKQVWARLATIWPVTTVTGSQELTDKLKRRFLHRQAVEAARCMAEGVLEDPRHADVGAILGWNFPRWTGGPLSYIEQVGVARFSDECDALAAAHGERFAPPDMLRRMAAHGETFYAAGAR
jgi:3-hydroxyacyl-CoA dehydrogenase / enoyl-CoA hydratase / 3-hydroxybutyryl-CoA epimerase